MNDSIVILDFSPRNNGNCAKIGEYIENHYNRTNVRSYKMNTENILPCHDCNYECLRRGAVCPSITEYQIEVMDRICSSDMVYMVIPNFCGYPNANYFAFNERSVGYFNCDQSKMNLYMSVRKRFIIVSNTESDTFRDAMKQQTLSEPEVLYLKSSKYGKRSIDGDILESADAKKDLEAFLAENSEIPLDK